MATFSFDLKSSCTQSFILNFCFSVKDDMIKRVADARMGLNWDAAAVKEAESASAQTREELF